MTGPLNLLFLKQTKEEQRGSETAVTGYLVDIIVDLVCHFFELVVGRDEVSLVWVEVSILPATLSLGLVHIGGQIKSSLERLNDKKKKGKTKVIKHRIFKATMWTI